MGCDIIAQILNFLPRKPFIHCLDFLQQSDVRGRLAQPVQDDRQSGLDRIDVKGSDPHLFALSDRERGAAAAGRDGIGIFDLEGRADQIINIINL